MAVQFLFVHLLWFDFVETGSFCTTQAVLELTPQPGTILPLHSFCCEELVM